MAPLNSVTNINRETLVNIGCPLVFTSYGIDIIPIIYPNTNVKCALRVSGLFTLFLRILGII